MSTGVAFMLCCMSGCTLLLRVLLSAIQPENIKVPLLAHVGSEDKFFPSKVITVPSAPLPLKALSDGVSSSSLRLQQHFYSMVHPWENLLSLT